jgi:membrane protease YdiL (CAAX protease family)
MSANYLNRSLRVAGAGAWVVAAFMGGQLVVALLFALVAKLFPGVLAMNDSVLNSVVVGISYAAALALALGLPVLLLKDRITAKLLGLWRLLSWSDIGLALLAVLPYILLTALITWFFTAILPVIDARQAQAVPFEHLGQRFEYLLAFVTLVLIAPLAEEVLFRGYLFGKMTKWVKPWSAVLITALIFSLMHVPAFTSSGSFQLQWGVAADTFALGIVLASLRTLTDSIWAGVLLHMLKNAVAYFFLFIYPLLTGTM